MKKVSLLSLNNTLTLNLNNTPVLVNSPLENLENPL